MAETYLERKKLEIKGVTFGKFKEIFHPHKALVVGSGGFPVEDFLSIDLELLFA